MTQSIDPVLAETPPPAVANEPRPGAALLRDFLRNNPDLDPVSADLSDPGLAARLKAQALDTEPLLGALQGHQRLRRLGCSEEEAEQLRLAGVDSAAALASLGAEQQAAVAEQAAMAPDALAQWKRLAEARSAEVALHYLALLQASEPHLQASHFRGQEQT